MSDDNTELTRPIGGCWLDHAFVRSLPSEIDRANLWEVYEKVTNCPPGAGLVGTMAEEGGFNNRNVHWRQIKSLLDDPFIQKDPGDRMTRIFSFGIGIVGAVPFCVQEERGMVLYFSRSTADTTLLHASSNERCLLGSADLIGATHAIRKARKESDELRLKRFQKSIKVARKEFLKEELCLGALVMDKDHMKHLKNQRELETAQYFEQNDLGFQILAKKAQRTSRLILKRIIVSQRKWRGARLHGPPRKSFSDCLFSFTGAFLTMLALLKIAKSLKAQGRLDFDAGWYSSTLCIVFALTPAPVGQPRQIFMAHLWNMVVGLACRQIPTGGFGDFMEWKNAPPDAENGLPLIWVQALAVALGIGGQSFIGITHPPATGLSMIFASGPRWTWGTIAPVMLADSVVVAISVMFLNLSEKEQYPMFWSGLGWSIRGGAKGVIRHKSRLVRHKVKQTHGALRRRPGGGDTYEASYGSIINPV